ncbi:hypothetical protein [Stenotrophomonas maltophilia]|uniref:Response receiver domain-containing protein n=1 Tax=Stenotrophomonas maltophilia TaxID=40324 RepID=A0AAD0BUF5_STEMA|nr:hypothetical protein [Stenotrophomonas maltophilia]AUI07691.1 hypothetical protein SmaCSM2_11045 [Stenotrophomonas maltophilia]
MTLRDVFEGAEIRHAIIVDDAYDKTPNTPLSRDEAQQVIDGIGEAFDDLLEKLKLAVTIDDGESMGDMDDDQLLIEYLTTLAGTATLYLEKANYPGVIDLFKPYDDQKGSRRREVDVLEAKLVAAGLEVQCYGAVDEIGDGNPPQLLFLDLQMHDAAGGAVSTDAAVGAYKRIQGKHGGHPFVFLMSTLSGALPASSEVFRNSADIYHSQFEALDNNLFSQDQMFEEVLDSYARSYLHLTRMRLAIDGVVEAIGAAAISLRRSLLDLDIADYRILQSNTAGIEKMPMGVYVTELSLEYLSYLIESDSKLWSLAAEIDAWKRENIPRSRFALRPSVRDLYTGNVIHAPSRLEQEAKLRRGPKDGFFYLGDIFFRAEDCAKGKIPRIAMAIATPACDLARPDKVIEGRTILLCCGKVSKTSSQAPIPTTRGGLPVTLLSHPAESAQKLHVEWDIKKLVTWDSTIVKRFMRGAGDWTRVGRLRPLYALQLQHAITSDLSRVGTQRPPSEPVPHGVELLVRLGGKWKSIDAKDIGSSVAAAVYRSTDGADRYSFVLADPTLSRLRRMIYTYHNSTDRDLKKVAKWLMGLKDLDRKLIYLDFSVKKDDPSQPIYPLSQGKRKLAHPNSIVFIDKRIKCAYGKVGGGVAQDDAHHTAHFAIRFVSLSK